MDKVKQLVRTARPGRPAREASCHQPDGSATVERPWEEAPRSADSGHLLKGDSL